MGEGGTHLISLHLTVSCELLQVTFEGIRGNNYQSDISIDDFSLAPGGCSGGRVTELCVSGFFEC